MNILSSFNYISYNNHIKPYLLGGYFEDDFFYSIKSQKILKNYNTSQIMNLKTFVNRKGK